jgi:hypothetical protein
METDLSGIDGPVMLKAGGFEATTDRLDTTAKIWSWTDQNSTYKQPEAAEDMADPDAVRRQALVFYKSNGGTCAHFAAFHLYCSRKAGRKCGAIYSASGTVGHVRGFAIEADGLVSLNDNEYFYPSSMTKEELAENFKNSPGFSYFYLDQDLNQIKGDFLQWLKQ